MDKVTFNSLAIEVTHRCNMKCAHCLRGDAENIDMTHEVVDDLLNQTQAIYNLLLSGGEPTTNLGIVKYIADGIEKRGIALFNFSMVTNALVFDPQIIIAMKHFYRLVTASRRRCGLTPKHEATTLGISIDRYHEHQDIVKENAAILEKAFKGTVNVAIMRNGNNPIAAGRAKNLLEAKNSIAGTERPEYINFLKERRIEMLTENVKPLCPEYRSVHLFSADQKMICCNVCITPNGFLINHCGMDYESERTFPKVCHVSERILQAVDKYNSGKTPCAEWCKKYKDFGLKYYDPDKYPEYVRCIY